MKKLKEFNYQSTQEDLIKRLYNAQKMLVKDTLRKVKYVKDRANELSTCLKKNDIEEILYSADNITIYFGDLMQDIESRIEEFERIKTGKFVQIVCDSWWELVKGNIDYLVFNVIEYNSKAEPEFVDRYLLKFDLKEPKKKAKRCKNG